MIIVHFRLVNFVVYKVYLNTIVKTHTQNTSNTVVSIFRPAMEIANLDTLKHIYEFGIYPSFIFLN